MRPATKAEGRKKKKGKVQRARDDDQAAPSTALKQPSRPPATCKAGSRHAASRQSSSLSSGSWPASFRQADPSPAVQPQGRPPFQFPPEDPPREAYIAPPTPAAVLRTVPSESVLIKAFSTPNYKITKSPPGPSRLGVMSNPCYPHGVKWDSSRNKWRVDIYNMATGACKSCVFSDAASAARYHDLHALGRFGGRAVLNFPKGNYMQLPGGCYVVKPTFPSAERASEEQGSMGNDVEPGNPGAQKQPMSLAVMIGEQTLFEMANPPVSTMGSSPWASTHHASPAQPGPTDPAAEPHVGAHTQVPHLPAPPSGSQRRLVRKATASAGPAEPGRSSAGRGPKQQGSDAMAEATSLAEEEEDWDVDALPRKRAQQGSGARARVKSSAAPRASKRIFFKGVTLKNKRSVLALMNRTPSSAC